MKLSKILKNIGSSDIDCEIDGISYDSRKAKRDFLFVAIKGLMSDGHQFLKQAQQNGACVALVEKKDPSVDMPQIEVANSRLALAQAANNFYERPTDNFDLIGVTGTNGKTTVTYMIESIFKAAGKTTGLIGTVKYNIAGKDLDVTHTTPESLELQELFNEMKEAGVNAAIMEVSSHAAKFNRIDGSRFDQVIFTNLTQDHMDFHRDFDDYFASKKKLFQLNKKATKIINIDDGYGKKLLDSVTGSKILTYGLNEKADFMARNLKSDHDGTSFELELDGKIYPFELQMGGYFNVYNALAAIACATDASIDPETIRDGLARLQVVPGRFEMLKLDAPFKVIVDYAHTPDGLKNVLSAAKQITDGRLIAVFGCGGDRDADKRPMMGKIAASIADIVVTTSDNPRSEDPELIIEQITINGGSYIKEANREKAIAKAISMADENDTIVIAGKGHETTQEINGAVIPFNDREVATSIWQSMSR